MPQTMPLNSDKLQAENERLRSLIKQLNQGDETWYNTLFDESNQALVVCETFSDFPATIVDCNAQFRHLLKRSKRQLLGTDFMELMRKGEKRKFFVQAFGNTKEKDLENLPLVFMDGSGNALTLEISTTFFDSTKGRLALVYVQVENHHKAVLRNGIEQLLSKSNQIFFGIKVEEILQFDYVSVSAYKVTGYSSEQLLLNPFLFWNNCHPEDLILLKKALKSEQRFKSNLNLRFVRHDGQMIWLEFGIITSPTKDNTEASHYAVARDITAQQKRKRQLDKKELYDQLILQSAKSLIGQLNTTSLRRLVNYLGTQLPGERFSLYMHQENAPISYDIFADHITTDIKTYAASNSKIWDEFRTEFIHLPVLVYQSDDDNFNFKQHHISFFNTTKIKSALFYPLTYEDHIFGFVGCSTLVKHYRWDRTDINFLSQLEPLLSLAYKPDHLV